VKECEPTYMILRFSFWNETEVIETGLTLEAAQEWCQREDTRGEGWFDGYTREEESDGEA
jgi:hypothetical protein